MKTLILSAIRSSLMFSAAAAFSLAYPVRANLITNGGFETGDFTGWKVIGLASVEGKIWGIPPHSGNFQAFVVDRALSQSVATTPGVPYTITFFLAHSGFPLFNSFSVSWGGVTIFNLEDAQFFDYRKFTFNLTTSDPSTELLFEFNGRYFGGWHLDDVSVNPVGVPDGGSTVSLLGFALLGLTALRRKLGC